MKSVIFKRIRIKNFLSIGNEWVEIDYKQGINVVTGMNYDKDSRNGIGKSAVLTDSLSFVLFGAPIREIKKEFIGNRYTQKSTKIILSFDIIQDGIKDEYVSLRSVNPTKLQLIRNKTDNITKSSIPKTTDFVCKLIGATSEVFANTVIMTLNNTVPFMAQKKVDKRKFIEGVLNLEVFSNMLLLARQEYNDTKKEFDTETTRLEEVSKTLLTYKDQQNNIKNNKQSRIDELKQRFRKNENELENIRPGIHNIDTNITTLADIELLKNEEEKADSNINDGNKTIGKFEAQIKHIDDHTKELVSRGEICAKCKRSYTNSDKAEASIEAEKLQEKRREFETNILSIRTTLEESKERKRKCVTKIQLLRGAIEENTLKIKENENLLSRIEQLNNWNKQINRDIAKVEDEVDHFNNLIEETKNRETVLTNKCAELKDRLSIIEAAKFIVSEEGVKSYIVKKILKVLNTKLMYYLKAFDSNCTLKFNEYFEENLIDEKGMETTYNNFSAGERKRIDLACLFTFMDIRRLQGDVSTNISIYDELFDSSLEEKGVFMVMDVLKERVEKYGEAIYVVSHRPTAVKSATGDIIYLEKRNGMTTRSVEIPKDIFI